MAHSLTRFWEICFFFLFLPAWKKNSCFFFLPRKSLSSTHTIFRNVQRKIKREYVVFHDFEILGKFFFPPQSVFFLVFFLLEKFTTHSLTQFQQAEKKNRIFTHSLDFCRTVRKNKLFREKKYGTFAPSLCSFWIVPYIMYVAYWQTGHETTRMLSESSH